MGVYVVKLPTRRLMARIVAGLSGGIISRLSIARERRMMLARASPSRLDTTWPLLDRYFGLNIRIASTSHPYGADQGQSVMNMGKHAGELVPGCSVSDCERNLQNWPFGTPLIV
jgi:hypothetical protein